MKIYTVWMTAPVNVRVLAGDAEEAKRLALEKINESERPEEVNGDDMKAVYFDGTAWELDKSTNAPHAIEGDEVGDDYDPSGFEVINPERLTQEAGQ